MATPDSCCSPCPTTPPVQVPGAEGPPGENGTNGVDAFTFTTQPFVIPTNNGVTTVDINVAVASWIAVGQFLAITGVNPGEVGVFQVTAVNAATGVVTVVYPDFSTNTHSGDTISTGTQVSPSGSEAPTSTVALSVFAAGSASGLTTSPAVLGFSITAPALGITAAGTYVIIARARLDYVGATFVADQTVTLKLRRVNNTPADIPNTSCGYVTETTSARSATMGVVVLPTISYTTANTNDALELWGSISAPPYPGSVQAVEASIIAIKIA